MNVQEPVESFAQPSNARVLRVDDAPIAEVRFRLAHALVREGFEVLNQSDFADLLNRRLDAEHEPYFIYEICHPVLAEKAMAVSPEAGLLLACNVCVWQEGRDVVVATLPPSRLASALARPHLDGIVREVEERLERVFERVSGPAPEACEIPVRPAAPGPALSVEELDTVREAVQRQIQTLQAEVAGTESRALQHAIARTIEQLEVAARKLDGAAPGRPRA